MAKVGLIFGGRSAEHLVSVRSARSVRDGLVEAGHSVVPLGIAPDGTLVATEIAEAALAGHLHVLASPVEGGAKTLLAMAESLLDVVFPIVHGTYGEDGTLQGLCEMLDLPYVGPNVAASAVAMDKVLAKAALSAAGVPVVEYRSVTREAFEADANRLHDEVATLGYPLFVKPSVGGSSVGVRRVTRPQDLNQAIEFALRFHDVALIEREVKGRELECAVMGYRPLSASTIGEIVPGREFYDYEDKYVSDGAKLLAPAPLAPSQDGELRELAIRACHAIGADGMARVDFFLQADGRIYVNEINTLPGFTRVSMFPRLWELSGAPLPALVDHLLRAAFARHENKKGLDEALRGFVEGVKTRVEKAGME